MSILIFHFLFNYDSFSPIPPVSSHAQLHISGHILIQLIQLAAKQTKYFPWNVHFLTTCKSFWSASMQNELENSFLMLNALKITNKLQSNKKRYQDHQRSIYKINLIRIAFSTRYHCFQINHKFIAFAAVIRERKSTKIFGSRR